MKAWFYLAVFNFLKYNSFEKNGMFCYNRAAGAGKEKNCTESF